MDRHERKLARQWACYTVIIAVAYFAATVITFLPHT